MQCFSMQFVMNKCFLLKPEKKIWRRSVLTFSEKKRKYRFKMTSPSQRLGCSNNQLNFKQVKNQFPEPETAL